MTDSHHKSCHDQHDLLYTDYQIVQTKMPPKPHNFRPYFILVKNTKNKENAIAVCLSCINNCDGGLEETKLNPECYISNKVKVMSFTFGKM